MSLEINGQSCPICRAYLFEEDDVAVCPTCGAVHHRDCFKSKGECGLAAFHGTENQFDLIKERKNSFKEIPFKEDHGKDTHTILTECVSCHHRYPANEEKCPECETPNRLKGNFVFGADPLGGVDKNEELAEGITADEMKNFVLSSTPRLIPKFKEFKEGRKNSFNIRSLLFPAGRFACRKMYLSAIFTGILQVAATLMLTPFAFVMENMQWYDARSLAEGISSVGIKTFLPHIILALIGINLYVAIALFCAFKGDKIYYNHAIRKVKEIKEKTDDAEERQFLFQKFGGLNLFSFILCVMIIRYLPTIIYALAAGI